MKKKFWALIVSMMVFIGAVPGLTVFADPADNVILNVSYGGVVNDEIKSDKEGEFGSAGLYVEPGEIVSWTAKADEDHYFIGWSTDDSADNVFSKDKTLEFTVEESETYEYYALFEKYITVTFHFGTIENPDIIEPIEIKGTVGSHHGEFRASDEYQAAESKLMAEFGFETAYFETPRTKSLKAIVTEEAYDSYFLDVDDRIYITSDVYETMMLPITSVSVTLDPPVAGKTNETLPVITVPDGFHYSFPTETEDLYSAYWFDPNNTEETYDVTFECDNTYYARFCLRADTGYYFDLTKENVTVNNDKPYQIDEDGLGEQWMEASVKLEHNWSEWEPTTQATATKPGILTRSCSVCNASEEEYTLETAAMDNDAAVQPAEGQTGIVQVPDINEPSSKDTEELAVSHSHTESLDSTDSRYNTLDSFATVRVVDGVLEGWNGQEWVNCGSASQNGFAHIEGVDGFDPYTELIGATIINNATQMRNELARNDDRLMLKSDYSRGVAGVRKGSLIIDLYPEYVQTLEAGDYTFTAYFINGGSISINFTVAAKESSSTPAADTTKAASSVPSTGEVISSTMIWGAVLVSVAVIGSGVVLNKKRLGKKDLK